MSNDALEASPRVELVQPQQRLQFIRERFGLPDDCFEDCAFFLPNPKLIYASSRDHEPPLHPEPDAIGLPFLHIRAAVPKLTTPAAMVFGRQATQNIVELEPAQLDRYLRRLDTELNASQRERCTGRGHVLLAFEGYVLGLGFLRCPEDGPAVVESHYPKARALRGEGSALEESSW